MALAMHAQTEAQAAAQLPAFAPTRQLPPIDSDVPRRASITDPLLHAHASLPGSADGVRRNSDGSDLNVGFGAGAAFTAGHQPSLSEPGRSHSPERSLHERERAPSMPTSATGPVSPANFATGSNYALSYGWPPQAGGANPYASLKRKSVGLDDGAIDGSDYKRRSSVDGARLATLSLEAEQEERRRSSTSTNWSSSGSSAYQWQPSAPRYSFGAASDPRQIPSAIADQLAAYNFGQPPAGQPAPAATRFAPTLPLQSGAPLPAQPSTTLSPSSASRMMGGMALATLAAGQGQYAAMPPQSLLDHRRSLPTQPSTLSSVSAAPADETGSGEDAASQRSGSGGARNPAVAAVAKETPYSRSPELRVSHKLAERKRRKEMKELFDELRDVLPVERGLKNSKWEILAKAVEYIGGLKTQNTDLAGENEVLRSHLAALSSAAAGGQHVPTAAAAASAALALGGRPIASLPHRNSVSSTDVRRASGPSDASEINRAEADRTPLAAPAEPWPGHHHPAQYQAASAYVHQQPPPHFFPDHQPPASLPQIHQHPSAQDSERSTPRPGRSSAMQTGGSEEDAYGEPDGLSPHSR